MACSAAPQVAQKYTCSLRRDKESQGDFHLPNNGITRHSHFEMARWFDHGWNILFVHIENLCPIPCPGDVRQVPGFLSNMLPLKTTGTHLLDPQLLPLRAWLMPENLIPLWQIKTQWRPSFFCWTIIKRERKFSWQITTKYVNSSQVTGLRQMSSSILCN